MPTAIEKVINGWKFIEETHCRLCTFCCVLGVEDFNMRQIKPALLASYWF